MHSFRPYRYLNIQQRSSVRYVGKWHNGCYLYSSIHHTQVYTRVKTWHLPSLVDMALRCEFLINTSGRLPRRNNQHSALALSAMRVPQRVLYSNSTLYIQCELRVHSLYCTYCTLYCTVRSSKSHVT